MLLNVLWIQKLHKFRSVRLAKSRFLCKSCSFLPTADTRHPTAVPVINPLFISMYHYCVRNILGCTSTLALYSRPSQTASASCHGESPKIQRPQPVTGARAGQVRAGCVMRCAYKSLGAFAARIDLNKGPFASSVNQSTIGSDISCVSKSRETQHFV